MILDLKTGLIRGVPYFASPNCDDRPQGISISAIIVHSISLPPGQYPDCSNDDHPVALFFQNRLPAHEHPYFAEIAALNVSSHLFIRRSGALLQMVPLTKRAWHAGESYCNGRTSVNDFSIGIELEGWDDGHDGFTDLQYQSLQNVLNLLYDSLASLDHNCVFAHSDIAPGRKNDPGPYFDWSKTLTHV